MVIAKNRIKKGPDFSYCIFLKLFLLAAIRVNPLIVF